MSSQSLELPTNALVTQILMPYWFVWAFFFTLVLSALAGTEFETHQSFTMAIIKTF